MFCPDDIKILNSLKIMLSERSFRNKFSLANHGSDFLHLKLFLLGFSCKHTNFLLAKMHLFLFQTM